MKSFSAFFLSLLTQLVVGQIFPDTLDISVTYRDFLPVHCLQVAGVSDADVAALYNKENLDRQSAAGDVACALAEDVDLWSDALINGEIAGHPDFQGQSLMPGRNKCEDINPEVGFNFPVGSCRFPNEEEDASLAIVGRTLKTGTNGLPTITYCDEEADEDDNSACGVDEVGSSQIIQTTKANFDQWYSDSIVTNRRVGGFISLAIDENAEGIYSTGDNSNFFPLEDLKDSIDINTDDPSTVKAWPETLDDEDLVNGFWFTTEMHTTFLFDASRDMTFTFSGDDDFYAYINGHLIMDIAGTHNAQTGVLDLLRAKEDDGEQSVQEFLGLVDGEIYTLDIFHAERQTDQSNFEMDTSLITACSVSFSGLSSFSDFSAGLSQSEFEEEFSFSDVTLGTNGDSFILQDGSSFSSNHIFTTTPQNLEEGFDVTFNFQISDESEGFAFVVQAATIEDFPKTGGNTLNVESLTNSLVVAFDLCSGDECTEEIRVHFPDSPNATNDVNSEETLRVFDSFMLSLIDGTTHSARIIFYGGSPDFLEVFVDDSLYLRQSDFNISEVIGSSSAFVGFTSSNTIKAGTIEISDFNLRTVQVDASNSLLEAFSDFQEVLADGETTSDGFNLVTFDLCDTQFGTGGLEDVLTGKFIEIGNSTTRSFFNSSSTPQVEDATIVDNNDGTYSIQLKTETVAEFSLVVAFGEECSIVVSEDGEVSFDGDEDSCFFEEFNNGEPVVQSLEVILAPTAAPTEFEVNGNDGPSLAVILSSAGGVIFLGLIAVIFLVRYRKKWLNEKSFIEQGNALRLETALNYTVGDEYKSTGQKLIESQQEILALQTAGEVNPRTKEIQDLEKENNEMKNVLKDQKAAKEVVVSSTEEKVKTKKRRMDF